MSNLKPEEESEAQSDDELVEQFRKLYAIKKDVVSVSDERDEREIVIELEAIQKMLYHVYEFGNFGDPIKKWKEVYGLLIGKIIDNKLVILDAAPITHGTSRGVEFKKNDYSFAAKINDMLINNGKGEFFVGWYHSHPAIGLFLSGVDLKNQLGYQMVNDVAVAIVFDHCLLIENTIPFKVFRLDSTEIESETDLGYHVVNYEISGLNKNEILSFSREIHDGIRKELKKTSSRSAEKLFKKEINKQYKEFLKMVKKEKLEIDETDSKALRMGKRAKVAKKKKSKKKKDVSTRKEKSSKKKKERIEKKAKEKEIKEKSKKAKAEKKKKASSKKKKVSKKKKRISKKKKKAKS
ncbi:MAG: hypothetical protein ACTSVE_02070 [Candidatus Helarchaeota archaeon]